MSTTTTIQYITHSLYAIGQVYLPSVAYERLSEDDRIKVAVIRDLVNGDIYCL